MLKTQIAPADLLLGCYWPAKGSALLQRLLMLEAPRPSRVRVGLGLAVTVALATIAGLGAWATQPAETVVVRTAPAETPLSVKQGWSPGDTARNSQAVSGPKMLGLEPFGQGESPAASASDVAVVEQSPALVAPRASAPDLGLWSGALFSQIQTEQPAAVARASMREAADDDDAQREVGWIGGERLVVRVGGEVTYYQSQRSIIVLRGRQADIEHVTIRDGLIEYDDAGRDRRPVDVEIYAPSMRHLTVVGARELNIERFDQESLELVLTHVGDTEAEGRVGTLHVQTTGDGRVDLEKLRAGAAHVVNGGDGRVSLAARELADITISGRGDVALTTQPASVVGRGQGKGVIRYPKTLAVDRPPERIKGRPGASLPARAPPNSA